MAGTTSHTRSSVTARALSLLYAFDDRHRELSLTCLARRARLPVPTTYRLASELVAGGALARRRSGEFVVGRKLWDVGLLAPMPTGLREVASPFLNDIHATTRATVQLAIRDGDQVLYLETLAGQTSVPVLNTVGTRLPMHSTGVGKVLLAHAPAEVQHRALGRLVPITPHTITRPTLLHDQLSRVRRDGYATTAEEMTLGACSIAVPIHARRHGQDSGPIVAAIGVVVPTLNRGKARFLGMLQVAALGISRSLPSH